MTIIITWKLIVVLLIVIPILKSSLFDKETGGNYFNLPDPWTVILYIGCWAMAFGISITKFFDWILP